MAKFRMTIEEYFNVQLKKKCPHCGYTELAPHEISDCKSCGKCEFGNSEGHGCFVLTCLDCGHDINRPYKEEDEKRI